MIVKEDGTITQMNWEFKGRTYELTSSQTRNRSESVWKTIDTIKREDGKTQKFTRKQLKEYFNNQ